MTFCGVPKADGADGASERGRFCHCFRRPGHRFVLAPHRRSCSPARLAQEPHVALASIVHVLVQTVFYDEGDETALTINASIPSLHAEGIEDSAATKRLMQHRGIWATDIPEQPEALWDWLLACDADTLCALLTYCVACTVKPERGTPADRLAAAVSLDMKECWQPTVSYFGRVPKPLVLEAVTEGKGSAAADNIATLKNGEMAANTRRLKERLSSSWPARAGHDGWSSRWVNLFDGWYKTVELLSGTGWLPAILR